VAETRKLASIPAADVVGYSKLAGSDEERTLALGLKRACGAGSRRAIVLFEGDDRAARNRTQVSCTARGLETDDRGRALSAGLSLM
jgi:hypothetical protein